MVLRSVVRRIEERVFGRMDRRLARVEGKLDELLALTRLGDFREGNSVWTDWSISPVAVERIVAEIESKKPGLVVECGCGGASAYLAIAAERAGGSYLGIEHDERWVRRVGRFLEDRGLTGGGVVHAPLVPYETAASPERWYEPSSILDGLGDRAVDLLVVDGPPGTERDARRPALEFFKNRLADSYTVYIDDIDREDEKSLYDGWEDAESRALERVVVGSVGILRSVPS